MGVSGLWQIIESIREPVSIDDRSNNLILAIDLGCWLCQLQTAVEIKDCPYFFLRGLFFRTLDMILSGFYPVFVIDGTPPELKSETIKYRSLARFGFANNDKACRRKQFASRLKQCKQMLEIIGLQVIESTGEAEATCAFLDEQQLVDGVVTEDGDAFLYGAKSIYRNFSTDLKKKNNAEDSHSRVILAYRAHRIQNELSLSRRHLIAFALLVGCDYCPAGVAGVGPQLVLKLFSEWDLSIDPIERLRLWRSGQLTNIGEVEIKVMQKALTINDFPDERIIQEFLCSKFVKGFVNVEEWRQPNVMQFQQFMSKALDWKIEYSKAKLFPLVTLWNQKQTLRLGKENFAASLFPTRIVKQRQRQRRSYFEIVWKCASDDLVINDEDMYVSLEQKNLFELVYPAMVEEFKGLMQKKSKVKKIKNCKTSKICITEKSNKSQVIEAAAVPVNQFDDSFCLLERQQEKVADHDCCALVTLKNSASDELDVILTPLLQKMNLCASSQEESDSPLPLLERLKKKRKNQLFPNV